MVDGVDQIADEADDSGEDSSGVKETLLGGREFRGSVEHREPGAPELKPAPDGIPEKFWDPIEGKVRTEDLIKSYSELEKKIGAPKEDADEDAEEGQDEADQADESSEDGDEQKDGNEDGNDDGADDGADAPLASAVEAAQAAYAETGELSPEVREPLKAHGITDEQIDFYLAGVKATQAALQSAAEEAAGSAEDLAAAMAWAGQAWAKTPKKAHAFNAQMGDVETVGPAVAGLMAEYRKANPGEGKLTNKTTGHSVGDVYTHMDDFQADLDQADKLRDKNARRKAIDKLRRSRAAGTITSARRQPFGN